MSASGVSDTSYFYDGLGRTRRSTQRMCTSPGICPSVYNFGTSDTDPGYTWNLADSLLSMKFPSGRNINWQYTLAQRQLTTTSNSFTYASEATYTPTGGLSSVRYGSNVVEQRTYNPRSQLTGVSATLFGTTLLSLANSYGTTQNNGNLLTQTIQPLNAVTSFSYDGRNRLEEASETVSGQPTWQQSNRYDEFGNRWVPSQSASLPTTGQRPNLESWYRNPAGFNSNRMVNEPYDAAGNLLSVLVWAAWS